MTANDQQEGGSHYRKDGIPLQHWDIVAMFGLDYFQGNITKYIFRWRDKGGIEDLKKARHYLDKYIELMTAEKEQKEKDDVARRIPETGGADGAGPAD